MTNQDSALDLKIGPKDKDSHKKKQKKKLTRKDKELSWSLKTCKTLEWLSKELKSNYYFEPTREAYRWAKHVLKNRERTFNKERVKSENKRRKNRTKIKHTSKTETEPY